MHSGNKDSHITRHFVLATAVVVACITLPANAGDEDMNPTAYSQFDPVTGYMVPIKNPPQGQQNHNTATSSATSQPQAQQDTAATTAAASPQEQVPSSSSFWIYLLAAIVIVGGLAAWIRRGTRNRPGNVD